MTGNIAPRNSGKQVKANYHSGPQSDMAASPYPTMSYADYLHMTSACEDRRPPYAMRNSYRELIMPMEKHQHHGFLAGHAYRPRQL
jgi:hypothetical protein